MRLGADDWMMNQSFGQVSVTFAVRDQADAERLNELLGSAITIDVKKDNPKRSVEANAYLWVLLGKLANKLRSSPVEIYKHYIRNLGDNYEILPVKDKAINRFMEVWSANGYGWICEKHSESRFKGYTNLICFYGSSSYDTAQMAKLIDSVVEDCKANGIEVLPEEELKSIIGGRG